MDNESEEKSTDNEHLEEQIDMEVESEVQGKSLNKETQTKASLPELIRQQEDLKLRPNQVLPVEVINQNRPVFTSEKSRFQAFWYSKHA